MENEVKLTANLPILYMNTSLFLAKFVVDCFILCKKDLRQSFSRKRDVFIITTLAMQVLAYLDVVHRVTGEEAGVKIALV